MRTVFHVSRPDALAIVPAKVRNLLADGTVDPDSVKVVIDDSETVTTLGEGSDIVAALGALPNPVEIGVCSNALSGATVDTETLPAFVETLSSGVGELTRVQADGYAYIRLLG
jgi:intracellular sulfur oxidation DsrE/DsrF family protein